MKIRNIYFGKGIPFFCIAVTLLCITVTLISQLIPSTFFVFAFFPLKYPWQIITWIFLHGTPQELLPPDAPTGLVCCILGGRCYHYAYNRRGIY